MESRPCPTCKRQTVELHAGNLYRNSNDKPEDTIKIYCPQCCPHCNGTEATPSAGEIVSRAMYADAQIGPTDLAKLEPRPDRIDRIADAITEAGE